METYHFAARVATVAGLTTTAFGLGIELNNPGIHHSTYEFTEFLVKAGAVIAAIGIGMSYDANRSKGNEIEAKNKGLVSKL
jgi:hypothetical protein